MKQFVLLAVGYSKPTKEARDAWTRWFASIKEHIVDSGNPFGSVMKVTASEVKELPRGKDALAGYIVIRAKDMTGAVKLAKGCPIISSIRIYEATSM